MDLVLAIPLWTFAAGGVVLLFIIGNTLAHHVVERWRARPAVPAVPAEPEVNPFEDKLEWNRQRRRDEITWFYEKWDRIQPRYAIPPGNGYRQEYLIERAEREWRSTEMDMAFYQRTKLRELEKARKKD